MLAPWKKSYGQPRLHIKKQRHYFTNKGPSNYNYASYSVGLKGVEFSSYKFSDEYHIPDDYYTSVVSSKVFDYMNKPVVYDLNGELTTYVSPKDDEAYVNYYHYSNTKEEEERYYYYCIYNILDYLLYDQEAYSTLYSQSDEYHQMANRLIDYVYSGYYPEEYDYAEEKRIADEIVTNYFDKTVKRAYIFEMANRLINGFEMEVGDESAYPEFSDFRNKVSEAKNPKPYDMSHYEEIRNYVLADSNHWLEHYNLYFITGSYNYEENSDYNQARMICDNYNNRQPISDKEWEFLRTYVEKYIRLDRYESIEPNEGNITPTPNLTASTYYYKSHNGKTGELKVIGYIDSGEILITHNLATSIGTFDRTDIYVNEISSEYQKNADAKYGYAITKTDFTQAQIAHLLSDNSVYGYDMTNEIYTNLQMMLSLISTLKQVFLIAGIVFGVFAALMLFNFISTSISAKTKEIGILRAVGARGNDLFKIFFSESGLIALICSIIAIGASIIACWRLNVMMNKQVGLSMLDFGPINVGLILAGAVLIAVLGTLIPVIVAAKKPPVESIRTL